MFYWKKAFLIFAGIFAALSIALAATGSHALYERLLADNLLSTFDKATHYAMYHALALLGLFCVMSIAPAKQWRWVGLAWVVGTLLFSGSLFFYTLTGIHGVVVLTPVGGVLLIIGWVLLAALAFLIVQEKTR